MSRSLLRLRLPTSLPTRSTLLPSLRLSSSSSSASGKPDSNLTHPSLVRDPPAVTPQDPWPLKKPPPPPAPGPAHLYPTMAELLASPHPEGRDNEPTETLRKRLVYESRKRGILEMDLILATFAKERLPGMTDEQLREYDRFLTNADWNIFYWTTDKAEAPEPWASSWVLNELLEHARNKGRTTRSMPPLEERADSKQ